MATDCIGVYLKGINDKTRLSEWEQRAEGKTDAQIQEINKKEKNQFILDEHRKLFDELNALKARVKEPFEKTYTPPETNSKAIEEINNRFDDEIDALTSKPKKQPQQKGSGVGSNVVGKFYRVDSGFTQDIGATAEDVLNYEADELGNEDAITARDELKKQGIGLSKYSAKDIVWVTKNKKDAKRYGRNVDEHNIDGTVIIPDDGDGGMLILKSKIPEQKTTTVLAAPFYDATINNLSDAEAVRKTPTYKAHQKMLRDVSKLMGIKIKSVDDTIGGFVHDNGNKITEVSNRIHLETDDLDKAEQYAAVVGALAQETQAATIAGKYIEEGSPNANATEMEMKVDNLQGARNALGKSGLDNFTIDEKSKTVTILDLHEYPDLDLNDKLVILAEEFKKEGVNYENTKKRTVESRYVDSEKRTSILKNLRSEAEQRQSGSDIRNLYEQAEAANQEFINNQSEKLRLAEEKTSSQGISISNQTQPKEGDTVTLDPQIKGGLPRVMVFNENVWKQKVGGQITSVGKAVQDLAQAEWDSNNSSNNITRFSVSNNRLSSEERIKINNKAETKYLEDLQQYRKGDLDPRHKFQMGVPTESLLNTGLPDARIIMHTSTLKIKEANHNLSLGEMSDIFNALHNPVAVFQSIPYINRKVVVTDIKKNGNNLAIILEKSRKGEGGVNEVISIHERTPKQIESWMLPKGENKEGVMEWVNKEKALKMVSANEQQFNPVGGNQFKSITNVINNFENPKSDNFSVSEAQSEVLSNMVEDLKQIMEDEGVTELSEIQKIAKKELGNLYDAALVEKAFHAIGVEKAASQPAQQITRGVIGQVGKWMDKLFGGKNSVFIAKDETSLMKKAKGHGDIKFMNINGVKTEVITMPDVVDGFYSPIEKRIGEFKGNTASANKWKEIVGTKEEAKWTGVHEWLSSLKPDQQVSKADVLQHMKDNRIEIVEVVKGYKKPEIVERDGKYIVTTPRGDEFDYSTRERAEENLFRAGEVNTKHSDYQIAGEKENYREVLITMPEQNASWKKIYHVIDKNGEQNTTTVDKNYAQETADRIGGTVKEGRFNTNEATGKTTTKFQSSHFGEPNILVHLRMNTRTDAEGKKVLFLEEVQSDWSASGRKKGFDSKERQATDKKIKELWDKQQIAENALYKAMRKPREVKSDTSIADQIKLGNKEVAEAHDKANKIQEERMALVNSIRSKEGGVDKLVPEAPFVTETANYVKLSLKYALRHAVEEGAEKIAWTTGTQQNSRYDLSKYLDDLTYDRDENGGTIIGYMDGKLVVDEKNVPENKLSDYVGKDAAERLIESYDENGRANISGGGLKVGGKGMIGFYGEPSENKEGIIGGVAKALVKELAGKEGKIIETEIVSGRSNATPNVLSKFDEKISRGDAMQNIRDGFHVFVKSSTSPEIFRVYDANDIREAYNSGYSFYTRKNKDVSTQHSIEITPELKASVQEGMPMFMKNPQGEILGFTHNGKIYLNGARLNPNTIVHEAGHIWAAWAKTNATNLYDIGMGLVENSKYLATAKANKFYQDEANKLPKNQREDYFKNEALAMAIGDKGAQFVTEAKRKSFADWARNLWNKISSSVGITNIKDPENLTFNEFTKAVAVEILQGGERIPQEISIAHAETAELRKKFGFNQYDKNPTTEEEIDAVAQQAIDNGYNVGDLLNNIEKTILDPTKRNNVEQAILAKHIAELKAKTEIRPTNANLTELNRAIMLSDVYGTNLGGGLRQRREREAFDNSLAGFYIRELEINGVAELTDQQKEEVKKEFNDLTEAEVDYKEKKSREQAEQAVVEKEQTSRKSDKKRTPKTKEQFAEERKKIIDRIREKLRQARGQTLAGIPYAKELIAIAPDIAAMTSSLIEEGIVTLDAIISKIHDYLKSDIPDITKMDVQDLIAGVYNEKKKPRSEISAQRQLLITQAQLLNKLESLENGILPTSEKGKRERNVKLEELRKQIRNHPLTKDSTNLASALRQIEEVEEDLRTGNFLNDPESKKDVPISKQTQEAKDKLIKLKNERTVRLLRAEYSRRTKGQKRWNTFVEIANIPRTIMSSTDFSAPLRQGLIPTISHPVIASKAFIEMFRQAVSQKRFDRWFFDLRETNEYKIMEQSKLFIADPHDIRLSVKEEAFMNNMAEKIPLIGRVIKGSERAYVSYLNKMRADLFSQGIRAFISDGKTFESHPDLYKGLASYVNNATGRGGMVGFMDKTAPVLNALFFSPRLISSRLNLMNPMYYAKLPKEVREEAYKDMAIFLGFTASVLALAALALRGDDDDEEEKYPVVELDPRSTDFAKIRVKDTRYDIMGGFQQYLRVVAQFFAGAAKSTNTGKIYSLDGKGIFGKTRGGVISKFFRGKLAPIPSAIVNFAEGTTVIGEKVTIKEELKKSFMPLMLADLIETVQSDGAISLLTSGLPATFGVGVQTFSSKSAKNISEIDDLPRVGDKSVERLKAVGVDDIDDLEKYMGKLSTLKFKDDKGKKKTIFNAKQIASIDSILKIKINQ